MLTEFVVGLVAAKEAVLPIAPESTKIAKQVRKSGAEEVYDLPKVPDSYSACQVIICRVDFRKSNHFDPLELAFEPEFLSHLRKVGLG